MNASLRLRFLSVLVLLLLMAFFTGSNFVSDEKRLGSPLLPDNVMRLGLDLQALFWCQTTFTHR